MTRSLKLVLTLVVLAPMIVLAANNKNTPKEKKAKLFQKVAAVSAADNTITITDVSGVDSTYKVDAFTVITSEGKPCKLADLTVGWKADVIASETKISRIDVTPPPAEKPDKKK